MPTGSEYSLVDFSNRGNAADYKDRQSEGRTGEFTQVRPESDMGGGTPIGLENGSTYRMVPT